MASQLKHKLAKTFFKIWKNSISVDNQYELFEFFKLKRKANNIVWQVSLPLKNRNLVDEVLLVDTRDELEGCEAVKSITQSDSVENRIDVELDEKHFVKTVLESNVTELYYKKPPKKVIVEFSSPNIAKPFHVGHLRSTLIGNCLANIRKKLGNDVVKMNYLGDWGTQFGLIQVGLSLDKYTEEDFKHDPLEVLLKAYVRGNAEAEKNSELYDEAKKVFQQLESGDEEVLEMWSKYREWTLKGLYNIYNRLGVSFDEFEWESDYNRKKAEDVLKLLEERRVLVKDNLGRKVAVAGDMTLPLIKSDDTTLYLMRDLVALTRRRLKYKFDEMYYVVDNGQSAHFHALQTLSSELKLNKDVKIEHVKFGRIHRMSTRRGKFIPLSDVLNEAREKIFERQLNSPNTKVSLENQDVADILGVSSIIVNDLKRRRIKDYDFSWDEAVNIGESSGISLQYSHCRLSNLELEKGRETFECDPEALSDPEAVDLAFMVARYEERLLDANNKLEPCSLTVYLFELAKAINSAYYRLKVRQSDNYVSQQRDLMFRKSREVLNEGMRLIGLKPLKMM